MAKMSRILILGGPVSIYFGLPNAVSIGCRAQTEWAPARLHNHCSRPWLRQKKGRGAQR